MAAMSDFRVDISVRMDLSISMTSARVGSAMAAGMVVGAEGDGGGLGFAAVAAGVGDDGAAAEDRLDRDTRLSRAW
jgi:hypothetical protein